MSKVVNKDFGRQILHLRQSKKITQVALARLADIHVTFLSGVEKGQRNISIETAQKIADALGVTLGDLFSTHAQELGSKHVATPVNFVKLGGTWDMQVTSEGLMGSGQLDDKEFAKLEEDVQGDEEDVVRRLENAFGKTKSVSSKLGEHLPWVPDIDCLVAGDFYPIFSGDSSHYRTAVMAPALAYLLHKATAEPERQIIAGMGTDTVDLLLPYLDAFLFDRHDIYPILVSGANLSFREEHSDAPRNFHDLAQATHLPLMPGAYYLFDRTIFKGGDITKVDPSENPTSLEGLVTFFAPQRTHARLGVLETGSIRRENRLGSAGPVFNFGARDIFTAMNAVFTVNLGDMPDIKETVAVMNNPENRAMVIVGHALGNIPYPIRRAAVEAAHAGKLVINVSRSLMGNTTNRYYVALGSANERELQGTGKLIVEGGRLSNRSAKALLVRALLENRDQASTSALVEQYKTRTF
ncbi:MAG: helix-turn-helix domain-containing protein [Patescibacteria group bacterium]